MFLLGGEPRGGLAVTYARSRAQFASHLACAALLSGSLSWVTAERVKSAGADSPTCVVDSPPLKSLFPSRPSAQSLAAAVGSSSGSPAATGEVSKLVSPHA